MVRITSEDELRQRYKPAMELALKKQLDHLDAHCIRFIGLSPFLVMASADAQGRADASPRGGDPGFVAVLDERTIAIPDSPGNNRLDTISNLLANPEIGLLFFVPGVDESLRINGTVEIRDDAEIITQVTHNEARPPATALVVHVRDAYLHCARSMMRAKLWSDEARIDRKSLPSMARMIKDQIGFEGEPESQDAMVERYRKILY